MVRVAKFGGSSVASAEQFRKVKNIVELDDSRRFVVVSAVGKADKDDPLLFAPAGKISILGQKTITGMNGIGFASFGSLYYFFYI